MLRIRSTRLLSGVSAIAMIASAGAISPASAGQTFTGPNLFPFYVNTQTDFIKLDGTGGQAVLGSDNAIDVDEGNSIINNLAMSGVGDKINIQTSVLTGGILNNASGSIVSSNADGIDVNNNSVIAGTIINNGLIQGNVRGITINGSTVIGGILNNASASIIGGATSDGIQFSNGATFLGGISNAGLVSAGSDGIDINSNTVNFVGGITNSGTIRQTVAGVTHAAIEIGGASFVGGINNTGLITGATVGAGGNGIALTNGSFAGGIINGSSTNSAATITGRGATHAGIILTGGTSTDDITNYGAITGTAGAAGIKMTGGIFQGKISNNSTGVISIDTANATAVAITGGTFSGGIFNTGKILALATGATGIRVSGTAVFSGGITNNSGGTIKASSSGIYVNSTSFAGGISNSGSVVSLTRDAINIQTASFAGGISNTGVVDGNHWGILTGGTSFTGGINNAGQIFGRVNDAVRIGGTTFTGDIVNTSAGTMQGNVDALHLIATTITGTVRNDGKLTAVNDGIFVGATTTVTGGIVNTGVIDPLKGIEVLGNVGTISNSGTITGTVAGIDLVAETAATTVTQTAGLLQGRAAGPTITDALRMNNATADVFNANGGTLDGNVVANNTDNMSMAPTGTFAWLRGTGTNLNQFDVSGSGTAVLGAAFRGDATGVGVVVGAKSMTNTGHVYIDDNTTVNLAAAGAYSGGTGVAEFYLTSNQAQHGQINATTVDAGAGNIEAFVDGNSFGLVGGNTFNYTSVFTGTTNGTDGAIDTNSLFFTGKAIFNANSVDIQLNRQSFASALILPGESLNEASVGAALDAVYNNPVVPNYGPDMTKLFNYLLSLNGGEAGDALFVYNELSGEEHAQLQQTTLDILNPFDTFMGHRLDGAKASLGGAGWAQNGGHQYAQASAVMSDASHGVARGDSGVSLWAEGYGQTLDDKGNVEAPGYRQNTGGAAGGVDFTIGSNALAGAALGWSSTDVKFKTPGDKANVDSFQVGAYGSYGFGRFYLDAQASGAFDSLSTTRLLSLPFGAMVAGANYDARSVSANAELGAVWHAGSFAFQPNAGVLFTDTSSNSFIESGAGDFNLIVGDTSAQSLASSLGMRASAQFKAGGMTIVPEASGNWRHEFDDDHHTFTAAFPNDPTSTFNIISSKISPDSALVEAGVTAGVTKGLELFVDYNGLYNSDITVHNGSAGLRATW